VIFVCKDESDDGMDGLLPRLDSDGQMTLSVGKFMSLLPSSFSEFVRVTLGEVGGVENVSISTVDISQAASCR
jgi:hypothetical protein